MSVRAASHELARLRGSLLRCIRKPAAESLEELTGGVFDGSAEQRTCHQRGRGVLVGRRMGVLVDLMTAAGTIPVRSDLLVIPEPPKPTARRLHYPWGPNAQVGFRLGETIYTDLSAGALPEDADPPGRPSSAPPGRPSPLW